MGQMQALIIAHEPDGPGGQVEVRLVQRGVKVHTHVVTPNHDQPNVAAPFPNLDGFDIVIPTGSVRSLTNKAEISNWVDEELELLRIAHKDKAVLGICFGGQLLAEALGGSVEAAPVTEIGWFEIQAANGVENPVGPGPWMQWHHDRFRIPPDATLLAETVNGPQLYRIGRTVGTQFHPEVDAAHIARFLEGASDEYLAENGVSKQEMMLEVRRYEAANIKQCHALVDWFLDEVAFPEAAAD